MLIADLKQPDKLSIGDTIYLVRKISGHVLETQLVAVAKLGKPQVEVEWLNQRCYKYKLDLEGNRVLALYCSPKHRADMLRLWEVWEPHRQLLKQLFYNTLRNSKK